MTARSFAAPAQFARVAAPLCTPGGVALVSEPPADEQPIEAIGWSAPLLDGHRSVSPTRGRTTEFGNFVAR